jgi:hypothetical protein
LTQSIDTRLIDQIVAEVLSQLRQRIDGAQKESNPSQTKSETSPLAGVIDLTEAVITEDTLKLRVQPGAAIHVAGNAILTPSARDYIRDQDLSLSRKGKSASAPSVKLGTIITVYLPEVVQSLLADVRKSKSSWSVELEGGTSQVVELIRSVICRGEARQVLVFVKTPYEVACRVNRNSSCRAAVVRNANDVRRVRSEFAANVICVDLEQPTFIGLREVLRSCGETVGQVLDVEGSEI